MDVKLIVEIGVVVLFVLYWHLLFQLINQILGKPKLKFLYRLPIYIANVAVTLAVFVFVGGTLVPFLVMAGLMFLEFGLLYKCTIVQNLFCVTACIIHVLAVFVMVTGGLSMITGHSVYELVTADDLSKIVAVVTLALLNGAIVAVIKIIPFDRIRIINQHKEQQWFLVAWMVVNNIYLLYSASVSPASQSHTGFGGNQVIVSCSIMFGLYIVLFFAIKTVDILGYQEKNAALAQTVLHEQQYRNSLIKDAVAFYEVNVTRDEFLHGLEEERQGLGEMANSYNDMLAFMSRKMIHSDDVEKFIETMSPSRIMDEFKNGKTEIPMEYRRLMENDTYTWVRATANLIQDANTGDLIAYMWIKDIDKEKRRQLELQQKAERDPLTGLYNKGITGKLINECIIGAHESVMSALFIIDVDNFKAINDHLGHVYGDAVLCELSDKLRGIFRSDDIIGRIGGDEFIAYIKSSSSKKLLKEKADEICKAFYATYNGSNGEDFNISSSIGIAMFPKDGQRFEELYKYADAALYNAKSGGKNRCQFYDGGEFTGYKSTRTEIQTGEFALQKSFRQNRIEYVFKILYQSENAVDAIHSALELVASHFSFERGYIFETSADGKTTSNIFEWCAEGIESQISNLRDVPIEAVATANEHFHETGTFVLSSLDELRPDERAVLEPQGIKSMFQFGIFDKNHLLGFIGFDNCRNETVPNNAEIDEIATICNILATFFVKQHIDEVAALDLQVRQEVMNHLDNYIYVVNLETFEVLFMNERTRNLMDNMESKTPCYSFFRGNTEQCADCPIRTLNSEHTHRASGEIYNEKLDIWIYTTASTLRWTDGSLVCLINCADVTSQKEERLLHIGELERLAFLDELTGCSTFYKFKADARRILEEERDSLHFIVKMDIDNFKLINQIYGYEKGDEVLCCVARAIERTVRNANEIFARVADDEFVMMFSYRESGEIFTLYDTFLSIFKDLMGDDFTFQCVFPYGIYLIKPNDILTLDIKDMFERANIAHKAAKQDKSIVHVIYDETLTQKALRIKEIENKMSDALRNSEFLVYLQPKYKLDSEMIGGAEALARWENENKELFFPGAFISVFERNGFVTKLDFYVLEKVCRIIKGWIADGIEPVTVSVNFSRLHLSNLNFVKELCRVVDDVGIERRYIEVEITETTVFDNMDTFEVLLTNLHEQGFTMSMDDFGSGCSALGMLKDLPVDLIKMDRSFFVNQKDVKRSKIVVGNIINMAAELGIRIVAEGVEEKAHIDLLRELHCDMVQGYYYAKPMPAEEFTQLIRIPKKFGEN